MMTETGALPRGEDGLSLSPCMSVKSKMSSLYNTIILVNTHSSVPMYQ